MECFAHRGFGAVNPENTLTAVGSAVAAGVDGIELDVRRCGSGELVVVHDATVDRVTGARGRVESFTAAELADLSVRGSGAGVPTLAAVCREVPPEIRLTLDLKERGTAADAVETARAHDCDLLVSAASAAALAETSGVDRAYIFSGAPELMLDEAADLGCTAVHPHWHLCTDSFLTAARDRGFEVNAWPAPNSAIAAAVEAVGVDGLIADAPGYCDP